MVKKSSLSMHQIHKQIKNNLKLSGYIQIHHLFKVDLKIACHRQAILLYAA